MDRRNFIGTIVLIIPVLSIAPELLISEPQNKFAKTIIDPVTGIPFECTGVYNRLNDTWKIKLQPAMDSFDMPYMSPQSGTLNKTLRE